MTLETLRKAKQLEASIRSFEDRMSGLSKEMGRITNENVAADELITMTFRGSNIITVNARRLREFLDSEYEECRSRRDDVVYELERL